jgi:hypothetical protein
VRPDGVLSDAGSIPAASTFRAEDQLASQVPLRLERRERIAAKRVEWDLLSHVPRVRWCTRLPDGREVVRVARLTSELIAEFG